jgi:hypothetical protein
VLPIRRLGNQFALTTNLAFSLISELPHIKTLSLVAWMSKEELQCVEVIDPGDFSGISVQALR